MNFQSSSEIREDILLHCGPFRILESGAPIKKEFISGISFLQKPEDFDINFNEENFEVGHISINIIQ